jgi:hypothetical protein
MGMAWYLACPSRSEGIASKRADYENAPIVQSVFSVVI